LRALRDRLRGQRQRSRCAPTQQQSLLDQM
jgi:hypothetical protein